MRGEEGSRRGPQRGRDPTLPPAAPAELWRPRLPVGLGETAVPAWLQPTPALLPGSGASEGSACQPLLELGPGEYRVLLCVDASATKG